MPKKDWWNCVKDDMEVLACSKRMHSLGISGEGELKGQPANPGSPGKMAVKTDCVLQVQWTAKGSVEQASTRVHNIACEAGEDVH